MKRVLESLVWVVVALYVCWVVVLQSRYRAAQHTLNEVQKQNLELHDQLTRIKGVNDRLHHELAAYHTQRQDFWVQALDERQAADEARDAETERLREELLKRGER